MADIPTSDPVVPAMPTDASQNIETMSPSAAISQPSASDATTAGAAVMSNTPASLTSHNKINSLADLRRKAPKVYKFMMLSLAQNICIEMKHNQDRLEEAWRKMRENQS